MAQTNIRSLLLKGELELTVDDPAYEFELAECRKFEIKEWLMRRFANQIIPPQELDRKLKLLEDADKEGHLNTAQATKNLKQVFGFVDPEIALLAITAD